MQDWKKAAQRAASRGTDARGVAQVAMREGATAAQAQAIAKRLCGYSA